MTEPGVSWAASLSLSCDTGHWLSGRGGGGGYVQSIFGVLVGSYLHCLLLDPFPQFSVVDGVGPSGPMDSFKEDTDECMDLQCCSRGFSYFSSIQ